MRLIVCLDISESMGYGNKIETAFNVIRKAFKDLGEGDEFALVVFETFAETLLEPTLRNQVNLEQVFENISIRGVTCLSEGLKTALELADEESTLLLVSDGRANLSLDKLWGFEGDIKLEEEAVKILAQKKINFYGVAVGEDSFLTIFEKIAEKTGGHYYVAEDFQGLKQSPKTVKPVKTYTLEVHKAPKELPAAQPTWTKESQLLHVAVVSDTIYNEYLKNRRAILVNPLNNRRARVSLISISSSELEPYRKRSKRAREVEEGKAILLDKTYRDYLQLSREVKLILAESIT